ncbi:hypothetical protein [Thalassoglobus polymorphus]|nr:hypothetical protein [Thalassoglobus polymorphus]
MKSIWRSMNRHVQLAQIPLVNWSTYRGERPDASMQEQDNG